MKTIKKLSLSAAFLFITAFGLANEIDLRIIPAEDSKTLVFRYDNLSTDATLKFIDVQGNVIFSESLEDKAEYSKRFNLNGLETGTYFLEVEDAIKETEYTILVEDSQISIENKLEKNKPVFRQKEGMVYLNLLNLSKEEVEVKVFDSSDRVVFNQIFENEDLIEKAFNFEKAYKDQYSIMVKTSSDKYIEDILVD
ncbi:MAG: T9SS type A sorting domain-containing protein [Maribacter sp.]|uniref:T9SS type A sorting domain-containing protein n=1 Tax=Maribacter sp. TaxID=1897614 RepID=UPI003C772FC9